MSDRDDLTSTTSADDSSPPAWTGTDDERTGIEPWDAAYADAPLPAQVQRLAALSERPGYDLHPRCFIADEARVVAERLTVGEFTTIASGCVLRGDLRVGAHCSLNVGASTIGTVRVGDMVRIATGVVLVGENHGFDDLDTPIAFQPMTSVGVVVEDDVWIGANVTVVDGVTVGAHSVVAAGAVVTRDVAPWSIVAGVPARVIGDRRERGDRHRSPRPRLRDRLVDLDARVASQWPDVLERCRTTLEGTETFVDRPGAAWGPRPTNDAIEIAGAFDSLPPGFERDELVTRVRSLQDPVTGLFPDPTDGAALHPDDPLALTDREWDMYGVISCGYALEVLGSGPAHPIHAVEACTPEHLTELLDALDHEWLAWPSGSWIDGFATAAHLNRRHHGSPRRHDALWQWLDAHVHRESGMWGVHLAPAGDWDFRWLMAVNGYYRLTRGAHVQFGLPLPHPEAAIDTVLAHWRDYDGFATAERNACNVLDVVHPLWALGRQTDYRRSERRDVAAAVLHGIATDWVDGAGMPWDVGVDEPGLQGTEMWLAVAYLAADTLGESGDLSWRPRGVHRLEAVDSLD